MSGPQEHSDRSTGTENEDLSPGVQQMLSRRRFMQTSTAAAVGAAGVGASTPAAAQSVAEQNCDSFGEIEVADDVIIINNMWGVEDAGGSIDQCSYLYDDGTFGWDFPTRNTEGDPNYPQALVGTKPWGDSVSGADDLAVQRSQIDELTMEYDVDVNISGGEWNLAEEWWLCDTDPLETAETHSHEIMLVCDWGGGHDHGGVIEHGAFSDQYGNSFDYWANYQIGWDFHIFRLSNPSSSGQIDLTAIMDYMEGMGVGGGKWVTGVELGNEYWNGAGGETTFQQFDVTINGTTYASGSGNSVQEPPSAPASVSVDGTTTSSIDVSWSSVDAADEYDVSVDGSYETTTTSTSTTVSGLTADTQYTLGVEAVNDAGRSDPAQTTGTTEPEQSLACDGTAGGSATVDGQTVCDVDGDGYYRDVNGDSELSQADVTNFFEVQHRSAWKNSMFDFDGSGSVSHGDVVQLFEDVAT